MLQKVYTYIGTNNNVIFLINTFTINIGINIDVGCQYLLFTV